jgi:L-rhamnose isomerase
VPTFADIASEHAHGHGHGQQAIVPPSWGLGSSRPRFMLFARPGVPSDALEEVGEARQMSMHAGLSASVALRIPCDAVDDFGSGYGERTAAEPVGGNQARRGE